jgi:uracil-DNA glycosylase
VKRSSARSAFMHVPKIRLEKSWEEALHDELQEPHFADLCSFLEKEYASGKPVYPRKSEIFAAFDHTPFDRVKVVVIGQDPYHRPDQAHGLCFSVRDGVKLPRSLQNIFKEISDEFHSEIRKCGDLTGWAERGVLLLNRALTVEEGKPGSHQSKWKCFTETVIKKLAARNNLVFIAWGNEAQKAVAQIDTAKHKVLKSAHPARRRPPHDKEKDFFGNNHFRKANEYLLKTGQECINWQL